MPRLQWAGVLRPMCWRPSDVARFVVTVSFHIRPGRRADFLPLVRENAAATLAAEPGCLQFDVLQPEGSEDAVFLYEIYQDAAAFDAHLTQPHFLTFDQAVRDMVAGKFVSRYVLEDPA
jgi:(4S)-4-hydroxy-5-phosphonooxypentane-2,3-dione isomerase